MVQRIQENSNLSTTVEDRAADLYDQMQRKLAHSGKEFQDVGKKQQRRHLTQIQ